MPCPKYLARVMLLLSVLWLAPAFVLARATDCLEIVQFALDATDQLCAQTGRNQACYGHLAVTTEFQPGAESVSFQQAGDIVDVALVDSLSLNPMDESTGEWGVALMNLQANLPDTLPGQNVTFILFGDVEITNAVSPDDPARLQPMQAFYLRTGIGDAPCEEAPESGLVVQTPEGGSSIVFNVNGVDVEMGSTVFFQADIEEGMTVSTLEGAAYVSAEAGAQPILAGTWARIPLDERLQAAGAPAELRPYTCRSGILNALPLRLLERDIEIAPAMEDSQFDIVKERITSDEPLCGEEGLPDCEAYPFLSGERQCLLIQGPLCVDRGPNRPGRPGGRLGK